MKRPAPTCEDCERGDPLVVWKNPTTGRHHIMHPWLASLGSCAFSDQVFYEGMLEGADMALKKAPCLSAPGARPPAPGHACACCLGMKGLKPEEIIP